MKKQYTDEELQSFEKMMEELVVWMFYQPNQSHPILEIIKKAYDLGECRAIGLCQSKFNMKKESLSLDKFEEIKKLLL